MKIKALLVAGSTTSSVVDIYVMSISYNPDAPTEVPSGDSNTLSKAFHDYLSVENKIQEVRVGYLGLCARTNVDLWICQASPYSLIQALGEADQTDPLNLIWLGDRFRNEALPSTLLCVKSSSKVLSHKI